jgi:ferredoxin
MRLLVDRDVCDLHGQCVFTAPALCRFDEAGKLEFTAEVPAELEANARAAVSVCPTGAIKLLE